MDRSDPDAIAGRSVSSGSAPDRPPVPMQPGGFPERITPHIARLIDADPSGPVARQFVASHEERDTVPWELADPLGEERNRPLPRLVRKYLNRALLLTTDTCAAHCRYCFRRNNVGRRSPGGSSGAIARDELTACVSWLRDHREIEEVLLSGGDPLTLSLERLSSLVAAIRAPRPQLLIRVCTRVPVVAPERITDETVSVLRSAAPCWVVVQINHPAELDAACVSALRRILEVGVPVVSQTVLLRGVNDDLEILADLCSGLLRIGVKPYQLFQADLVPGTRHFRVPLSDGVELYRRLGVRVSTLALPVYSLDAPGGGGKIRLGEWSLDRYVGGWYQLEGNDGVVYRYPDERTPDGGDAGVDASPRSGHSRRRPSGSTDGP